MFKKVLLATSLLASTACYANYSPTIYIGAGMGVAVNTSNGADYNQPGYFRGVPFNVLAGYGGLIDQNFYLAGEFNGTFATAEITNKNGVKTTYGYNVSVLPGLLLTDHTFAFGRVGFAQSRFSDASALGNGAIVGLGMQSGITQNVDLRGEYDFTAYRNVSGLSSPRQDAFNLSLIYRFE